MSVETIVAAAIEQGGIVFSLPRPARHHDIILTLPSRIRGRQGFVTDAGRFVDRWEARGIAVASGQVVMPMHATLLFSEDLW